MSSFTAKQCRWEASDSFYSGFKCIIIGSGLSESFNNWNGHQNSLEKIGVDLMDETIHMKKHNVLGLFLFFIWAEITLWVFRKEVSPFLDLLFTKVLRKSFSQRSVFFQLIVITLAAIMIAFLTNRLLANNKINRTVTFSCLAISLVFIVIICAMQTIRRDDYWEIHDARLYGFPGFIRYEYVNITGRYFSLFIKSLYQFVTPTIYMNILLAVNILLLCAGCIKLVKLLIGTSSIICILIGGVCSAFGMIFMSPNIWEVWFWAGGTFIYGIGITCAIWVSVLMINIELSTDDLSVKTAAAALCIICACGTSELITASVCSFSFMIFILPRIICHRKWNKRNALLCMLAWMITVFILLTSGDVPDAQSLSGNQAGSLVKLILSVPEKVNYTVEILFRFLYSRFEYVLIFSGIAFLLGMCSHSVKISIKSTVIVISVLAVTAVGSLMINALIDFMPARVISIPLDWIYLGISLIMLQIGSFFRNKMLLKKDLRVVPGLISLVLLTVTGHFYMGNIGTVLDIRTAWIERDQVLSAMDGSETPVETCAVPVMGSGRADPSDDPAQDFNIVTAYYYGFPSITADHLCPPFE